MTTKNAILCRQIHLAIPVARSLRLMRQTTIRPFGEAFAGSTPAPRGRLSHPLSRGWTVSGSESEEHLSQAPRPPTASLRIPVLL